MIVSDSPEPSRNFVRNGPSARQYCPDEQKMEQRFRHDFCHRATVFASDANLLLAGAALLCKDTPLTISHQAQEDVYAQR
jgi:hypothetical protein